MGASESKLAFRRNVFTLHETRNIRVDEDAEYWSKFFELPESAEDIYNLFAPKDIRKIRDSASENLEVLLRKACDRILKFAASTAKPEKDKIRDLLNSIRILTRVLPYIFENYGVTEGEAAGFEERVFWTSSEAGVTDGVDDRLGPRIVRAVVQLLFFKGLLTAIFCRLTLPDVVSDTYGTRYVIWEKGVGSSNAPPSSGVLNANRIELLRLLLVILSPTMYAPTSEVLQRENKWAVVIATGLEKKATLTLLCSLLNTGLSYDPVGWGLIPYNHVIFGDSHEQYVSLCLQALIAILDLGSGSALQKRPSIIGVGNAASPNMESFPPVKSFPTNGEDRSNMKDAAAGNNEFRFYLSKLHRVEDMNFILDGIQRLLKNPLDSANTFLPGVNKRVLIHVEVLMIFWKMYELNEKFAKTAVESEKILIIVAAILYFCIDSKSDMSEYKVLSQERAFAVQLNTPFDHSSVGIASKPLPLFSQGCWGDFMLLSIHTIITTSGKTAMSTLHENFLISLANVSPYIKSLTVVSANKILNLFQSFSNPGFMLANETNHKLVFYLLDIFNNIVQYQITGNTHLVYAIVRHRKRFHEINDMTFATAFDELQRLRALKAQKMQKMEQAGVKGRSDEPVSAPTSPRPADKPSSPATTEPPASVEASAGAAAASAPAAASATSPATAPPDASTEERKEPEVEEAAPAEMSEKAKGKLPASQASGDMKLKFQPTEEWFSFWKSHLRLNVLITLVDALGPPIEALCIEKEFNDDKKVIEYLQSGTLVGLLPLPHPLFVRKFTYSEPVKIWFTSYLWGCVYVKSAGPQGNAEIVKLCPPVWTALTASSHGVVNLTFAMPLTRSGRNGSPPKTGTLSRRAAPARKTPDGSRPSSSVGGEAGESSPARTFSGLPTDAGESDSGESNNEDESGGSDDSSVDRSRVVTVRARTRKKEDKADLPRPKLKKKRKGVLKKPPPAKAPTTVVGQGGGSKSASVEEMQIDGVRMVGTQEAAKPNQKRKQSLKDVAMKVMAKRSSTKPSPVTSLDSRPQTDGESRPQTDGQTEGQRSEDADQPAEEEELGADATDAEQDAPADSDHDFEAKADDAGATAALAPPPNRLAPIFPSSVPHAISRWKRRMATQLNDPPFTPGAITAGRRGSIHVGQAPLKLTGSELNLLADATGNFRGGVGDVYWRFLSKPRTVRLAGPGGSLAAPLAAQMAAVIRHMDPEKGPKKWMGRKTATQLARERAKGVESGPASPPKISVGLLTSSPTAGMFNSYEGVTVGRGSDGMRGGMNMSSFAKASNSSNFKKERVKEIARDFLLSKWENLEETRLLIIAKLASLKHFHLHFEDLKRENTELKEKFNQIAKELNNTVSEILVKIEEASAEMVVQERQRRQQKKRLKQEYSAFLIESSVEVIQLEKMKEKAQLVVDNLSREVDNLLEFNRKLEHDPKSLRDEIVAEMEMKKATDKEHQRFLSTIEMLWKEEQKDVETTWMARVKILVDSMSTLAGKIDTSADGDVHLNIKLRREIEIHHSQQRKVKEDIARILEERQKTEAAKAATVDQRRRVQCLKECMTCTPDMEFPIQTQRTRIIMP
ncbi:hypothetical protein HK101_008859 [Irineochytrium annulatum]|nr:hypothetical protein HK101_008859 [Irineochytrium annulatum]